MALVYFGMLSEFLCSEGALGWVWRKGEMGERVRVILSKDAVVEAHLD